MTVRSLAQGVSKSSKHFHTHFIWFHPRDSSLWGRKGRRVVRACFFQGDGMLPDGTAANPGKYPGFRPSGVPSDAIRSGMADQRLQVDYSSWPIFIRDVSHSHRHWFMCCKWQHLCYKSRADWSPDRRHSPWRWQYAQFINPASGHLPANGIKLWILFKARKPAGRTVADMQDASEHQNWCLVMRWATICCEFATSNYSVNLPRWTARQFLSGTWCQCWLPLTLNL